MTRLRLTLSDPVTGNEADAMARLYDDAAPEAVAHFLAVLPIRETLRHVRWSGEAGYVLVKDLQDEELQVENRMSFFCRGTIGFRPEHGEVAIAYGSAQARDWWGIGWATRVGELEGDATTFLEVVRSTQRTGTKELVIAAEEE